MSKKLYDRVSLSADLYDRMAPYYRKYSQERGVYIEAVDRILLDGCRVRQPRLLDYGAGDGVRGAALADALQASFLVQADISDEMLESCRKLGRADDVWDTKDNQIIDEQKSFDLIFALWNVLGHVPSHEERISTLKRFATLLAPKGYIALDLNNRHNERYGYWRSIGRRLVDGIRPDYSRGDISFDWEVSGEKVAAFGHLFTQAEVRSLLGEAGLKIKKFLSVDYDNGVLHRKMSKGQFYIEAELA